MLVDVRRLTSDRVEELPDGGVRIGAAVPNSDLAADLTVRSRYPALSQALLSGRVRPAAEPRHHRRQPVCSARAASTSRTSTTPCNKREPGSGCSAIEGHNKNHAILGASEHCVATHPSDMAVAMAALDAFVVVHGPDGERRIPIEELHRLPGDEPERDTTLEHGELITAVDLPPLGVPVQLEVPQGARAGLVRLRPRLGRRRARRRGRHGARRCASRSAGSRTNPGARRRRRRRLRGEPANEANFRAAADIELESAEPLRDNAFKVPLARNVIARTLLDLSEER